MTDHKGIDKMMTSRYRSARAGNLLFCILLMVTMQACAIRTYHETPPTMPQAVEPVNAAVFTNGTPVRFVWRATDNTEHYDFHIFDRTTSDIERYYMAALKPESVCAGGLCSVTLNVNMASDTGHAWRVRAYNSAGNSGWTRTIFQIE